MGAAGCKALRLWLLSPPQATHAPPMSRPSKISSQQWGPQGAGPAQAARMQCLLCDQKPPEATLEIIVILEIITILEISTIVEIIVILEMIQNAGNHAECWELWKLLWKFLKPPQLVLPMARGCPWHTQAGKTSNHRDSLPSNSCAGPRPRPRCCMICAAVARRPAALGAPGNSWKLLETPETPGNPGNPLHPGNS